MKKEQKGNSPSADDFNMQLFEIPEGQTCAEAMHGHELQAAVLAAIDETLGSVGEMNFPEPVYDCLSLTDLRKAVGASDSLNSFIVDSINEDLAAALAQAKSRLPMKKDRAERTKAEIDSRRRAVDALSAKMRSFFDLTLNTKKRRQSFEEQLKQLVDAVKDSVAPINAELTKLGFREIDLSYLEEAGTAQQMIALLFGQFSQWFNEYAVPQGQSMRQSEITAKQNIDNLQNLEGMLSAEVGRLEKSSESIEALRTRISAASDEIAEKFGAVDDAAA